MILKELMSFATTGGGGNLSSLLQEQGFTSSLTGFSFTGPRSESDQLVKNQTNLSKYEMIRLNLVEL